MEPEVSDKRLPVSPVEVESMVRPLPEVSASPERFIKVPTVEESAARLKKVAAPVVEVELKSIKFPV